MTHWTFRQGAHDLGGGAWAYLQPDGSWGWNNTGLIVDGGQSLLVDTLFDERLTAVMLRALRDAVGVAGGEIDYLVNTHANGDHTYGNGLVSGARIIASQACAEELADVPPEQLAAMMQAAPQLGLLGEYLQACFAPFHFEGIAPRGPDQTFSGELDLKVGDTDVHLIEVGPAHTRGDVLVHVPDRGVIYTGDILFIEGTPIMWAGPVANWIRACDYILSLDVEVIVPGHGPITDKHGVRQVQAYLRFMDRESRQRYDAGMSAADAAKDIGLGEFSGWLDAERVAVNVQTLYKEYSGDSSPPDVMQLFALMAEIWKLRRR